MDVRIEHFAPWRVAFARHIGPYSGVGEAWAKLAGELEQIGHRMKEGISLFAKQWQALLDAEAPPANTG